MTYSVTDWVQAFQRHLPTGPIWSRDPSSVQAQSLAVLMPTWQRLAERDGNLLVDAFPATTVELLPEWEYSLGLPDPCTGSNPALALRRNQVVARLTDSGGASIAYFIAFAKALGYDITITEFAPARFGFSQYGQSYLGGEWAYVWQINWPSGSISSARFGNAEFGDPYSWWGANVLPCEIKARAPAHTTVIYQYGPAGNPSTTGNFIANVSTAA